LSPAEAQVYLILARKGPVKAGQIISDVKISSSNVHEALEKLAKKGVISFVVKNNVKEYNAVKPEMLRLIIDKEREELEYKESRLKFLIDEINSLEKSEKGNQNAEIFIGFNGLRNGFRKLLGNPLAGEEFVFFYNATEKDIKIVHEFFSKMDLEEDLRKIRTRALFRRLF
jgi:sugar-specific transcriptional regulator TrmB